VVDIPPEVQIRSTLRCGSVFYRKEESFVGDDPHYFVVLNRDPACDDRLVLINATSKLDKARARNLNPATLVIVTKGQYSDLRDDSAFEGDSTIVRTVDQLVAKAEQGEVTRLHGYMPDSIVQMLQAAVLASRQITGELKKLIDPNWVEPT